MPCEGCTPPPCNDFPLISTVTTIPECLECEQCEEVSDSLCTKYTGPNLAVLGVTNDMRLKEILLLLNKNPALGSLPGTSSYTVTVALNNKIILEYLDASGDLVINSVSYSDSPMTITAITGSPVITSGVGTIVLV